MSWEVVIGLEVHAQLRTESKIFSGASTAFGAPPNTQACAFDLGYPGVLPVLNGQAASMAVSFGLAVNADIARRSVFAWKNYFYPDLPKGYQISQFELPIVQGGSLDITLEDGWKLTGLNVKLDSQFDETVKAAAEVMKAVPTSGGSFAESKTLVRGTNIPFGLYEAIIGKYNCRKRLYGFRYVGFLPYSNCPVEFAGCEPHSCDATVLYGLVFDKEAGVMVFKELPRIPVENANPVRVASPASTEPDLPDADGNGDVNVGIEDAIHR